MIIRKNFGSEVGGMREEGMHSKGWGWGGGGGGGGGTSGRI